MRTLLASAAVAIIAYAVVRVSALLVLATGVAEWLRSILGPEWIPTVGLMVMVPTAAYLIATAVRDTRNRHEPRHTRRGRRR